MLGHQAMDKEAVPGDGDLPHVARVVAVERIHALEEGGPGGIVEDSSLLVAVHDRDAHGGVLEG